MENEVRMIDANVVEVALLEFRDEMCDYEPDDAFEECTYNVIMDCIRTMNAAPTIDPETLRPKGRWDAKGCCTNCGNRCIGNDYEEWRTKYCPYCGAKMKGAATLD